MNISKKNWLFVSFISMSLFFFGVVLIGLWVTYGSLEESVTGMGQMVPEGKLRRIMAPTSGVIATVLVEEDQLVKVGDVLVELDPEPANVEESSISEQLTFLKDEINALKAASTGKGTPKGTTQSDWLDATRSHYQAQLSEAEMQISKAEHQHKESLERQKRAREVLSTSEKLLTQYKNLFEAGGLSENEYRTFEQKVQEQRGELASLKEAALAYEMELKRSKQSLLEIKGGHRREIMNRLLDHEKTVLELAGEYGKSHINTKRQSILSPIDGVVNEQTVRGEGEVVSHGDVLLSLVPSDSILVAEVKVPNKDLAYIYLGQKAALRLDAFPNQQFGRLFGTVSSISPSTQTDEKGNPFYIIRIRPDKQSMKSTNGKLFKMRSGMTLTADLITRKKSILNFFTEPVSDAFDRAFRDPTSK